MNQLCGKINQLLCIGGNGLVYVLSDITADKFCSLYPFFWGNKQCTGNLEKVVIRLISKP